MPAARNAHVGKKGPVAEAQEVAQDIHLPVAVAALGAFVHLLKEHEVGFVRSDHAPDPLGAILAVEPADAFMDVVGEKPQFHGSVGPTCARFDGT